MAYSRGRGGTTPCVQKGLKGLALCTGQAWSQATFATLYIFLGNRTIYDIQWTTIFLAHVSFLSSERAYRHKDRSNHLDLGSSKQKCL